MPTIRSTAELLFQSISWLDKCSALAMGNAQEVQWSFTYYKGSKHELFMFHLFGGLAF